jgi:hypothetical protein
LHGCEDPTGFTHPPLRVSMHDWRMASTTQGTPEYLMVEADLIDEGLKILALRSTFCLA